MELKTIEHFDITVTLSIYDCEALAHATRHAAQLGLNSGLLDHDDGTTQEESTHLVGYLEALAFGFELAAKYAEDIAELRTRLSVAERPFKPPTPLEWEMLLRDLSPGQREAFQNLMNVFEKERKEKQNRQNHQAEETDQAESTDTSRIIGEYEL